jgi:CRISPR-associated protein Cmr4
MAAQITFVHALSPLHAGIGQGAGVIDLPIAREKATGLPFLPSSSLKGTLRSLCSSTRTADECNSIFGPEISNIDQDSNHASSVQFSDQRLLLLPIRSLAGTFAWVTSPYVLHRLLRDMGDVQGESLSYAVPTVDNKQCLITSNSKITIDASIQGQVYLEDLDLSAKASDEATNWATWIGQHVFPNNSSWQQMLMERICIVSDDIFNFLIETATEITARIKLKEDSKTVQEGGLWYEEALPTETILTGIVVATPTKTSGKNAKEVLAVISDITNKSVQLGGKATVGRGMCRVVLAKEGA